MSSVFLGCYAYMNDVMHEEDAYMNCNNVCLTCKTKKNESFGSFLACRNL